MIWSRSVLATFVTSTVLLILSSPSLASAEASPVETLIEALNIEGSISRMRSEVFEPQISADSSLKDYKLVIQQFYDKYMSMEAQKSKIFEILNADFTQDEMREMARFYSTPTGKKCLSALTDTLARVNKVVYDEGHKHLSDLKKMLKNELDTVSPDLEVEKKHR